MTGVFVLFFLGVTFKKMEISFFGESDVLLFVMNFLELILCFGLERVNEKGCFVVKELDP